MHVCTSVQEWIPPPKGIILIIIEFSSSFIQYQSPSYTSGVFGPVRTWFRSGHRPVLLAYTWPSHGDLRDDPSRTSTANLTFFSANQRNLIITPLFTSKMLSRRIATTSPTAHARAFHASATKASKEVIMNRYSRIITQPKAQGASQVRFLSEALRLTRLGHALRHRRHWEWRRLQQGHGWRCQCLVRRQPVSYFYWTRLTF